MKETCTLLVKLHTIFSRMQRVNQHARPSIIQVGFPTYCYQVCALDHANVGTANLDYSSGPCHRNPPQTFACADKDLFRISSHSTNSQSKIYFGINTNVLFLKKQLIWVFESRKSVHCWWSYITFVAECKVRCPTCCYQACALGHAKWSTADLEYLSEPSHCNVFSYIFINISVVSHKDNCSKLSLIYNLQLKCAMY